MYLTVQPLGIGGRCQPAQRLLRSLLVVFAAPLLDQRPGVQQMGEPMLVEAFVAQSTVEGFDIGVLVRFARLDQPQLENRGQSGIYMTPA